MLIYVAQREFAAHPAELHRRDAALFAAQLFLDLRFDGQTMTIPARDVGGAKTGHGLGFHDHVLENFVQSRAQMNRARRIRRAVMQNVARRVGARFLNTLIQAPTLPLRKHARLILRQARLHRKGGARETKGTFQVNNFRHSWTNSRAILQYSSQPAV